MKTRVGTIVHQDEYGLKYRKIFKLDHEGSAICVGRQYETLPDSRQQPKSLSYRLMEERNAKDKG